MTKISLFFLALSLGAMSAVWAEDIPSLKLPGYRYAHARYSDKSLVTEQALRMLAFPKDWKGINDLPGETQEERLFNQFVTDYWRSCVVLLSMPSKKSVEAALGFAWLEAQKYRIEHPEIFTLTKEEVEILSAGRHPIRDEEFAVMRAAAQPYLSLPHWDSYIYMAYAPYEVQMGWRKQRGRSYNPYQQLLAYRWMAEAVRLGQADAAVQGR